MGLSQELLAKKDKLCAEHYPKCITTECPLAKRRKGIYAGDVADAEAGTADVRQIKLFRSKERPAERQFRQGRR